MDFKSVGINVMIDKSVRFFNPQRIEIGDNVRIDANCIISGGRGIRMGSQCHSASNVSMFGGSGIVMSDLCNIAAYCLLLSESDDFSGASLIGPQIHKRYKPVYHEGMPILMDRHVIIGARSTILPGVCLNKGVAIGAHSLVKDHCLEWKIYAGNPLRMLGCRKKDVLELEKRFLEEYRNANDKP